MQKMKEEVKAKEIMDGYPERHQKVAPVLDNKFIGH